MSKTKVNRIVFVVDRSGSMHSVWRKAIQALNSNIEAIKKSARDTAQEATISLIAFDDQVEPQFFNRNVMAVSSVNELDFPPRDTTALFEATREAIQKQLDAPVGKNEDVTYLVNVITDGGENASPPGTERVLKQLMRKVQATDRWTLTFLVPPGHAGELVNKFDIPEGNVMEWEASARGVQAYQQANHTGISQYFQARAKGETVVRTFYAKAPSQVEVKANLDDLSKKFKVLTASDDTTIQGIVEEYGYTYVKGNAYYQLISGKSKADKVQNYKKVLVLNNKTKKIYGGEDARLTLGLPSHDVNIRPGDHGEFTIFVQSTSYTRKIKGGTKVLYSK